MIDITKPETIISAWRERYEPEGLHAVEAAKRCAELAARVALEGGDSQRAASALKATLASLAVVESAKAADALRETLTEALAAGVKKLPMLLAALA